MEAYQNHMNFRLLLHPFILSLAFCCGSPAWAEFGIIDLRGRIVLPAKYAGITSYRNKYFDTTLRLTAGRPGKFERHLYDRNGRELKVDAKVKRILHRFDQDPEIVPTGYSSAGRMPISNLFKIRGGKDNRLGLCDSDGKVVLDCNYYEINWIADTLLTHETRDNGDSRYSIFDAKTGTLAEISPWGIRDLDFNRQPTGTIDREGNVSITTSAHNLASSFSEGLRPINIKTEDTTYASFINVNNKLAFKPIKGLTAAPVFGGISIVSRVEGTNTKYGAIDRSGQTVIPVEFDSLKHCGRDYLIGCRQNRLQINRTNGELVCLLPDNVIEVYDNLDLTINRLIPCSIVEQPDRNSVIAPNKQKHVWGFCDLSGQFKIEPKFTSVYPFLGAHAVASIEVAPHKPLAGVIDKSGHWTLKPKYKSLYLLTPDRLLAQEDRVDTMTVKEKWHDPDRWGFDLVAETLEQYNLIGMKRSDIDELMGEGSNEGTVSLAPNGICKYRQYITWRGSICGNAAQPLELGFDKNDKVVGWTIRDGPWTCENVVMLDPTVRFDCGVFVPKDQAAAIRASHPTSAP